MSTHNRLAHWFGLIRTRLTLWIIIILAVGLLLFIGTTLIIAHQLLNNLNEKRLQQNVSSLSVALAQEPGLSPTLVQSQLLRDLSPVPGSTGKADCQFNESEQKRLPAHTTAVGNRRGSFCFSHH
jgi:hypothetical protein